MSKRRQTLAHIPISEKKAKTNDDSVDCDSIAVPDLTDKQLRQSLIKLGETPGREHVFKYYCLIFDHDLTGSESSMTSSLTWELG